MSRFQKPMTDGELLDVLERRERGQTAREIAAAYGRTRNAIIGICNRIRTETEQAEDDGLLPGPEANGSLSPGWWREGLDRRGEP